MARKKAKAKGKGAPKTSQRRAQPHAARHPSHSHGPAWAQRAAATEANRFSLADEARFTSGHRSTAFDAGKKLRRMPITFVSAGLLEGTIKEMAPKVVTPAPASPVNSDALAQMTIHSASRSPSLASSASSEEEVVVFRGRNHTPLNATPAISSIFGPSASVAAATVASSSRNLGRNDTSTGTPQLAAPSSDGQASLHPDAAAPSHGWDQDSPPAKEEARASGPVDDATTASTGPNVRTEETPQDGSDSDIQSDTNSVNDSIFEKRRGGKPIWEGKTTEWVSRSKPGIGWLPVRDRPDMDEFLRGEVDPRQAAMDDYMQNVEAFGLTEELTATASAGFSRREMDLDAGSHNDWDGQVVQDIQGNAEDGWDSDMLRDLDGMSTSSDVEGPVVRILNKRFRAAGLLQYLIVYEDRLPDDARWVPASFLKELSDQALIKEFENDLLSRPQPSSSETDSEAPFYDDEESDDDDEVLDDETIARVLQKQEELGLGSDELLPHAHDEYFSGPVAFDRPNKKRQHRVGGGQRSGSSFPSAVAMADALDMDPYGAFDIMDTERPSLRPVKKGRRGQMPPELDDSDLNDQIQATWRADRDKKRLKKAEREELRKQGLLGRKGKAPDLGVKYKDGVDMMEVVEDIRNFLHSEMQTLSLPPMEAQRRAIVHQVVNQLGVNSNSRGDGASRFTVLSKSRRTAAVDDDAFDAIIEHPRFKRRLLAPIYPARQKGPKAPKGKKTRPTVGYKDGDIVGASAPELGPENRGRALMEKMGWSKGMALGAHDNKGILHPIAHTVKTNKAGLQ
ncbi:hypothetical protein K458DRAFT_300352 [Lentithecium fluviatile CBS 122367]|uniref:Protein SQS1 n=1 Tax=Lentithecium fluviatile CBS 122367 TaxID=1168545 RepID=A0A6G1J5I7_9PLEO|nr:hypothetical protein K458DRAFT_300352 [Lentithecium fluviatile CBS 122367]